MNTQTNVGTVEHGDWRDISYESREDEVYLRGLSRTYHRNHESLKDLEGVMREESFPIIIYISHEEEKMGLSSNLALLGLFGLSLFEIKEFNQSPLIVGTVTEKQKPNFTSFTRHHRAHKKSQGRIHHNLPMKQTIPRGVYRDGHGLPPKQRLTPTRISIRNGSRK